MDSVLPTLVWTAQSVLLLEHGLTDRQTDRHSDTTESPIHKAAIAGDQGRIQEFALRGPFPLTPLEVGSQRRVPKTNLVHFKAVRKPLVAIIFSILNLKCMFYSRTIKI